MTGLLQLSNQAAFNTTTPGLGNYGLHFTGQTTADYATGITWNGGTGTTGAQAGIYVQGSGAYGTKLYIATTDSYATGSKTRLIIDQIGNVGINTTVPRSRLEVVNGIANTDADAPGTVAGFTGPMGTGQGSSVSIDSNDAMAINTGGVLGFGGRYITAGTGYANWASIKGLKTDGTSGNYGGYLSFFTRPTGGSNTERLRITGNGGISFGATGTAYGTAGQILQSNGDAAPTWVNASGLSAGNTTYIISSDDRIKAPADDSSSAMRFGFTSFANNNTSPWADYLHLRSYTDASGGNDNLIMFRKDVIGMRIWQQTFNTTTSYSSFKDVAFTDSNISGSSAQVNTTAQPANASYFPTFVDANNASAAAESLFTTSSFVINPSTGNVGIGTNSPIWKLHVQTTTTGTDGIYVSSAIGGGNAFFRPNISAGANNNIVTQGDAGIIYSSSAGVGTGAFVIAPWNNTIGGVRLDSNGNVRVATTTSVSSAITGALQIVGGVGIGGGLFVGGTVTATSFVGAFSGAVTGAATQVNTVAQTGNATYYPTFVDANNASAAAESLFTTSSFVINPSTGNIGINATPSYKLDVGGPIGHTAGVIDTSGTGSALRILSPAGGSYATGTATITGAIKIRLPNTVQGTMLKMTVKVYTYDGLSFDIHCGGYTYTGNTWYNTFAYMGTQSRGTLNVRFGHDGTYFCILIGEISTAWSYPQVFVTDFQGGYSSYAGTSWTGTFAVTFETTLPTIAVTQVAYQPVTNNGGSWNINAATATNLSTNRGNWSTNGTISAVVGQLAWKNYGNNHTIFDASQGTSPDGGAVNNTNAATAWTGTYPTLMGWNGSTTYGVRVDSARVADSVSGPSTQVNTAAQTANASYFPTFVDANNASATAESVFTTSSFVINPATGNVGIGGAPTYKLDINGGTLGSTSGNQIITQRLAVSSTNADSLEISNLRTAAGSDWTTAGWRLQQKIDTTWMGYMQFNGVGNQGGIAFGTGLTTTSAGSITERLRITPEGNVGIGTSTPTNAGAGYKFITSFGTTSSVYQAYGAASTDARLFAENGYGGAGMFSNHPFLFYTNSSERLRITTNGGFAFGGASNFGTSGQVLQSNGDAAPTWVTPSSGSVANSVTFNNAGAGDASGTTYNGSAARTISFNTLGAARGVGSAGGANLNTLTTSGMYRIEATEANRPGDYGQLLVMHGAGDTITQIYGQYSNGVLYTRSGNPSDVGGVGTWTTWHTVLDNTNYNSYSPTLTGTGASGTWGINISGTATNIAGGTAMSLAYQSSAGVTALLAAGTAGQVLRTNGTGSAPSWVNASVLSAGTATTIAGGTAGQILYQSAVGVTAFAGPGTAGQLLVSAGTSAPTYTNTASIYVGAASSSVNLFGGTAMSVHYQSAAGTTAFLAAGTAGQVLQTNGTGSAPAWVNLSNGLFTRITSNTTVVTGARIVADTAGGAFTLTLPSLPATGANVEIVDGASWATNNLTIGRNGQTIEGAASDLVLNTGGGKVELVYDGTTWEVYSSSSGGGFTSTDDTTTNANHYPIIVTAAGGSTARTSSTKLYFNPSSGTMYATVFQSLSDIGQKTNIQPIVNPSDIVKQLSGVEFNWIDTGAKSSGVIAQELEKEFPHLVSVSEQGIKSVNYSGIIAYLIESNKDLQKRIEALEAK